MKKTLMGTTAVAAAGLVAGPAFAQDGQITLSVGGYYTNWVTFVSQDEDGAESNVEGVRGGGGGAKESQPPYGRGGTMGRTADDREFNPVRFRHEGEIHFTGSTTLDNGLRVGFQAQLEAITQGDQMDETYLFFEGSWGRLLMGAENSAPYLMQYTAPSVGLIGVNSPSNMFSGCCRFGTSTHFGPGPGVSMISAMGGVGNYAPTATLVGYSGDAEKITYFTPRFSGFQFGVSYSPDLSNTTGIRRGSGLDTTNNPGEFNHTFAGGINFVETLGSVDVAVAGGIEYAQLQEDAGPTGYPWFGDQIVSEDMVGYTAGLNIGYAGFVFGTSFIYHDSMNGVDGLDGWAADVGVSYSSGPWGVSATYFYGQANFDDDKVLYGGPGDGAWPVGFGEQDRRHLADISVSYALSPGVTIAASGQYFHEITNIVVKEDVEGFGFTVGSSLSF